MALLGLSLVFASVVVFCFRKPTWLPDLLRSLWSNAPPDQSLLHDTVNNKEEGTISDTTGMGANSSSSSAVELASGGSVRRIAKSSAPSSTTIRKEGTQGDREEEEQTTPKASATSRSDPVPTFALSDPEENATSKSGCEPPPSKPTAASMMPPPPIPNLIAPPPAPGTMGPPPPRAQGLMPPPSRPPTLNPLPSSASSLSPYSQRSLPVPNRGAPSGRAPSSLALPPTQGSKPAKPSKQVILEPGHSPLDWARISSGPNADLRGLPPNTPYLRVTPSMLKRMTGRKGKDAWMALGGRVYNISPYAAFHPGGIPELMRGAARDGTRLFNETHPWVNYEGMLASSLVGILVGEDEGVMDGVASGGLSSRPGVGESSSGKMEEMD